MIPLLKKVPISLRLFLLLWLAPVWQQSPALAADLSVAVLMGKEIRPFIEMVEGLEARLGLPVVRYFLDPDGRPYTLATGATSLSDQDYAAIVAVGPSALVALTTGQIEIGAKPLVYGMVADPEALTGGRPGLCGIPLRIEPEEQFSAIKRLMPSVRRLGIIYDPANNSAWLNNVIPLADRHRIKLVPLPVKARSDIDSVLAGISDRIDALLFIPDATVTARPIIEYVIKQTLRAKIPVIGYNRYFHEIGAAISFVINYRAMGESTARMLQDILSGATCPVPPPTYEVLSNEQVLRLIVPPSMVRP